MQMIYEPEKKVTFEVKNRASRRDYGKLAKVARSLEIPEYYVASGIFSDEYGIIPAMEL